jgi:hypothetical protein
MPESRLTSLVVEMVGSAAICGLTYAAERLIGARRRRSQNPNILRTQRENPIFSVSIVH